MRKGRAAIPPRHLLSTASLKQWQQQTQQWRETVAEDYEA